MRIAAYQKFQIKVNLGTRADVPPCILYICTSTRCEAPFCQMQHQALASHFVMSNRSESSRQNAEWYQQYNAIIRAHTRKDLIYFMLGSASGPKLASLPHVLTNQSPTSGLLHPRPSPTLPAYLRHPPQMISFSTPPSSSSVESRSQKMRLCATSDYQFIYTGWCKRKGLCFKIPSFSAARQCGLPMHSQSAINGKS